MNGGWTTAQTSTRLTRADADGTVDSPRYKVPFVFWGQDEVISPNLEGLGVFFLLQTSAKSCLMIWYELG